MGGIVPEYPYMSLLGGERERRRSRGKQAVAVSQASSDLMCLNNCIGLRSWEVDSGSVSGPSPGSGPGIEKDLVSTNQ